MTFDWPELPFIDTMMRSIVFYGVDREIPVREARTLIDNICGFLGESPSHFHVGLDGGRRSRGPRYSMMDKAIAKGDFDEYTYIEGVNYFEKGNVRDCSLAVGISGDSDCRLIDVHYRRERKNPVDIGAVLQEVLRHTTPQYGILYDLTVREGPRWFMGGILSSGMPDALAQASSEFSDEYLFGKKFKDGFFRDIFKWNFLSPAHLDTMIEGMPFRKWIKEPVKKTIWQRTARSRGSLSMLDNGCAVWELKRDEAEAVRPRMLKAGLLMVKS